MSGDERKERLQLACVQPPPPLGKNRRENWEEIEIVEQESDKFKRGIKESICIRSNTPNMNRVEVAYQLSPKWTQVISTPNQGGGGDDYRVTLRVFRN